MHTSLSHSPPPAVEQGCSLEHVRALGRPSHGSAVLWAGEACSVDGAQVLPCRSLQVCLRVTKSEGGVAGLRHQQTPRSKKDKITGTADGQRGVG